MVAEHSENSRDLKYGETGRVVGSRWAGGGGDNEYSETSE